MKKIAVAFIALILSIGVKAQSYYNSSYSPDVAAFLSDVGDYLTKDIYTIDKSKLNLRVVILTDFSSGRKIGYVDYTSQDATGNVMKAISAGMGTYAGEGTYFTSSLDYNEIEKCIYILEYAKENLLKEKPSVHSTRFYYTSRLGGRIGVKRDGADNWQAFVNADPMGDTAFERTVLLEGKGIDKVIDAFKAAKEMIEKLTMSE